jgi:hypothetical protein
LGLVQFWAGARNCTKRKPVIKAVLRIGNHSSQNIQEPILIYGHRFQKRKGQIIAHRTFSSFMKNTGSLMF